MRLSERSRSRARVAVFLVAYLVACGLFVTVRDRSILLSILAIFAIVGVARELHEAGRGLFGADVIAVPPWRLGLLLVPGAVLVLLWYAGVGDGWGFFGLALLYLGGGLVVDQLRAHPSYPQTWGPWILGCCAGPRGSRPATHGIPWEHLGGVAGSDRAGCRAGRAELAERGTPNPGLSRRGGLRAC
jgi:hypothetical protein